MATQRQEPRFRDDDSTPAARWGKPPGWPDAPDGARGTEGLPTGGVGVAATSPAEIPNGGFKPAGLARGQVPRPGETDTRPGRGGGGTA